MDLLKTQVRMALRRALRPEDLTDDSLAGIMSGIEKTWIEWVHVYGFDAGGQARSQLTMHIDWSKYQVHIRAGQNMVQIDHRWSGDTAIEVQEIMQLFNEFALSNRLRTEWQIAYRADLGSRNDELNKLLGFKRADPVRWAGRREGISSLIPELDEMNIDFYIVT